MTQSSCVDFTTHENATRWALTVQIFGRSKFYQYKGWQCLNVTSVPEELMVQSYLSWLGHHYAVLPRPLLYHYHLFPGNACWMGFLRIHDRDGDGQVVFILKVRNVIKYKIQSVINKQIEIIITLLPFSYVYLHCMSISI